MIKILHVVHTMECGGIETMLMNIYRKIDRTKIQFDFLINGAKENYYTEEIIALGGNVLNVTPKRESLVKNIRDTVAVMKRGNYQIVHIHQDSMISFAILCAKKAGIKNIFTHAHTTSANGWYRKTLAIFGRKYIDKNATLKFACSKAAAEWIYGAKEDEYILFKNAIDAFKFRYKSEITYNNRKELGIQNDQFVIGTCGRFSVEKNQKFLVEVFAEIKNSVPDAMLVLIGDGDEKQDIIATAEALGVQKDILFPGMVGDVEYYYSTLDCFILPSLFEGLPLVGVEAQAAGITSFFSTGVTEEIKINPNVYFLPLAIGAKEWAEKILACRCAKKDTYSNIKNAGYDIDDNVELLESTYLKYANNLIGLSK